MADHELPILNHSLIPGSQVFFDLIDNQAAPTNGKNQLVLVFPAPSAADATVNLNFTVPKDYAGTPRIILRGMLHGTPADTLAFGALASPGVADGETADVAEEAERLVNKASWSGYVDEDMLELTITLSPAAAYVEGDTIYLIFFRDDSVDDSSLVFLLTDLAFSYSDS